MAQRSSGEKHVPSETMMQRLLSGVSSWMTLLTTHQGFCREYCCVVDLSIQRRKLHLGRPAEAWGDTVTSSSWSQIQKCQANQNIWHAPESGCALCTSSSCAPCFHHSQSWEPSNSFPRVVRARNRLSTLLIDTFLGSGATGTVRYVNASCKQIASLVENLPSGLRY